MNKQRQVYIVVWEKDGNSTYTEFVNTAAPDSVKRMIAEQLLKELGINIRIEP